MNIDTRERILKAAKKVFCKKGYTGATTRDIAAEARVNEVTIFRHFSSKENLWEAIVEMLSMVPMSTVLEKELTGNYREDLINVGKQYFSILNKQKEIIRMVVCEADHFLDVRKRVSLDIIQLYNLLDKYLQKQIELKVVRKLNTKVAAEQFFGMFFAYSFSRSALLELERYSVPTHVLVAQYVDIFIEGTVNGNPPSTLA